MIKIKVNTDIISEEGYFIIKDTQLELVSFSLNSKNTSKLKCLTDKQINVTIITEAISFIE